MPKITISGIAVLAFLELRDRVWEGTGLLREALFPSDCAKTSDCHFCSFSFVLRIIITFPRAASEGVDSVAALPVV